MNLISVIILTKNEEKNIKACILDAKKISDDIIVIDSGSTDRTCQIVQSEGCRVIFHNWQVYAESANYGAQFTKYDWIFLLDADERLTGQLVKSINNVSLKEDTLYGVQRAPFIGSKQIKHGVWGTDKVYRLYNKTKTKWDDTPIHSKLYTLTSKHLLKGVMLHYTVAGIPDLKSSNAKYMKEIKRVTAGKKNPWFKKYTSSSFRFIKGYILLLGFLDGREGWAIACESAKYAYVKYGGKTKFQ